MCTHPQCGICNYITEGTTYNYTFRGCDFKVYANMRQTVLFMSSHVQYVTNIILTKRPTLSLLVYISGTWTHHNTGVYGSFPPENWLYRSFSLGEKSTM
jgi:hypothetical protein